MATTSNNAFRYPASSDAPDGAGAIYNLASDLDNFFRLTSWTPGLGGTGATLGNSPGVAGKYRRIGSGTGADWKLTGTFGFGSGASFGSGAAVINNLPVALDTTLSHGFGFYVNGSTKVGLMLTPQDAGSFFINPIQGSQLGVASALGTPPQSSGLVFTIIGTGA